MFAELAVAIDDGELVLHHHPVVELNTGQVTGVEASVRWLHPTRGLLMPVNFIPLAEASGLIVQLGDWVLRTGAAQAARWAARGRPLDVAIKLSPLQMSAPSFADHCIAVLAAVERSFSRSPCSTSHMRGRASSSSESRESGWRCPYAVSADVVLNVATSKANPRAELAPAISSWNAWRWK